MSVKMRSFPSLVAAISDDWFDSTSPVQFEYDGQRYAVGQLVGRQRLRSIKMENLDVSDPHWRALLIASMLQAKTDEANLVCGFPQATLATNWQQLKAMADKSFAIKTPNGEKTLKLKNVLATNESRGHAVGIWTNLKQRSSVKTDLIVISIGYGTIESIEIRKSGEIVTNSSWADSNYGLQRAAMNLGRLLTAEGVIDPDDGGTEIWYDSVMRRSYAKNENVNLRIRSGKGVNVLSAEQVRQHVDAALAAYVERDLKDLLRRRFQKVDGDVTVVLTGGGSLYDPIRGKLVDFMVNELHVDTVLVDRRIALNTAAMGYVEWARRLKWEYPTLAADFGNANTVYATT